MKRVWLLPGILLLLAVLAFAYLKASGSSRLGQPRMGNVVESIYGLGTVTPDQIYRAKAGVSVQIRDLPVIEGDQVKPGQVLARLEESVIRAPFAGTVTELAFKAGEIVPPQASILTLTNLDRLFLEVNLEQQSILRVKPGLPANVSFESLRSERIEGRVKMVYPRSAQFIVRIELERWPAGVLPGMTADVAIKVGEKQNVLLIPLAAISGGKVTRVRGRSREKVEVKLGVVDNLWAELVSGDVREGDELVVRER